MVFRGDEQQHQAHNSDRKNNLEKHQPTHSNKYKQISGAATVKEPSAAKHIHKLKNMIRQTKKINKMDMNISSFVSQDKDDVEDCES